MAISFFFHNHPPSTNKKRLGVLLSKTVLDLESWSRVAGSMGQSESVMPSELDGNKGL